MGFHVLGYDFAAAGAGDTLADMTALTDPAFSQRNGHYIFTEQYQLLAAIACGKSITDIQVFSPTINAIAPHKIRPLAVAAAAAPVLPSPLPIQDLRSYGLALPLNEEIQVEVSDNAAAAEHEDCILFIGTSDWNRNLPNGMMRLTVKATATPTIVVGAWSALAALTFQQNLRGGWYSMVGLRYVAAHTLAVQVNFPRMPLVNGRKLFPGTFCEPAEGNLPPVTQLDWLGWLGTFHTFEPPTIAAWGSTAGADAGTLYMDLIYHGANPPPNLVSSTIP